MVQKSQKWLMAGGSCLEPVLPVATCQVLWRNKCHTQSEVIVHSRTECGRTRHSHRCMQKHQWQHAANACLLGSVTTYLSTRPAKTQPLSIDDLQNYCLGACNGANRRCQVRCQAGRAHANSLEPGPSRARYFPREMLLLTTTARERPFPSSRRQ